MVEIKNLDAKQYFTVLIAIIVLADLVILLNIPLLRQILGFLCFTIILGLLILHILKLNKIEFLKKFVLSIGLSVAFLIFAGLLVNSFYPLIPKPLSLEPILISFNVILLISVFIAYKRNMNDFDIKDVFNFKLDLKDKLTSPLIFPLIFPFMAVFGTHLMNTHGNNIILLEMLFLIPAYVVFVCFFNQKFSKRLYPVVIFLISISLLLLMSLRSNHIIISSDTGRALYFFRTTLSNLHWSIIGHQTLNACLSISILPTIYQSILRVNDQHKTLYEIKRVLKDNGHLLVSAPLSKNIFTLFRKIKNPGYVTKVFDFRELKKVLTENGFEIPKMRGCGFFPPFAHMILLFCYRLFGEKITRKMIEMLDIFARRIPNTASSVVAVCKVNKKEGR